MNKDRFAEKLKIILNKVNLIPHDTNIYFQAFTHPSYANEARVPNNERLEFLGDAILEFLVTEFLYQNFPEMPEGEMSKLRSKYVCTKANADYARQLALESALLLGKGEKEHGGRSKQSVLANLFEAFLGAVYLDLGLNEVKEILAIYVFPKILDPKQDFFYDYKSRLQEYIQAESRRGVEYVLESEHGPSHEKTFKVSVYHEHIKLGTGIGKSKKEAEQRAAEDAIEKLALS